MVNKACMPPSWFRHGPEMLSTLGRRSGSCGSRYFQNFPWTLSWCETEIWLSLDGGKSFPFVITPWRFGPSSGTLSFDWTVPNTPTAAAVLDIRFGCEQYFPEARSVQAASSFVIGQLATH